MGAVYQARDLRRQAVFAIKEMSLSMIPDNEREQAIQNFKIEAKILWGLNHPNLPTFTGFFSENQRYYLVMEYIDGWTLEELLERNGGPFPERRVLGWARQLCDVLEYLHSQHPPIIFRDLKPGNVMLTRDGQIKLIDFGIARFFRPSVSQDTQKLGTPGFAPPEQYGNAQTDVRSDIYSLAMTLFQLLTDTVLKEDDFGLKNIRQNYPHLSPTVARALEKAASKEPEKRFSSVAEFRSALLGEHTFAFESGEQVSTPEELAAFCRYYPEEVADYLASGEIEVWLHEIGEKELARKVHYISTVVTDPFEAVEQFIRLVGSTSSSRPVRHRSSQHKAVIASPLPEKEHERGKTGSPLRLLRKAHTTLTVQPSALDFGEVYDEISPPLTLTISSEQDIQGSIYVSEPWILLDQDEFEGPYTEVTVCVNRELLLGGTHYTGYITIVPGTGKNGSGRATKVAVKATVPGQLPYYWRRRSGKTIGADLDEEEENYEIEENYTARQVQQQAQADEQNSSPVDQDLTLKYGSPDASNGWEPADVQWSSLRARQWAEYTRTFFGALMAGSMAYTIPEGLLQKQIQPSDPAFILVMSLIIPASALGAICGNWKRAGLLSRICTGMTSVLIGLAFGSLLLRLLPAPISLLACSLLSAAIAVIGINEKTCEILTDAIRSVHSLGKRVSFAVAGLCGSIFGLLLTLGFPPTIFSLLGIAAGIAIAILQMWRVDYLINSEEQFADTEEE
uniref:Protein kinase domain-containing protein n=1 Tax=Thermosporothrix sp. COM3 TaxID=2490863 RepID=A0A455SQE9_9CHLR|nr:hypothetical protein KTC_45870 [Thermosporothrix sp. COM3]